MDLNLFEKNEVIALIKKERPFIGSVRNHIGYGIVEIDEGEADYILRRRVSTISHKLDSKLKEFDISLDQTRFKFLLRLFLYNRESYMLAFFRIVGAALRTMDYDRVADYIVYTHFKVTEPVLCERFARAIRTGY